MSAPKPTNTPVRQRTPKPANTPGRQRTSTTVNPPAKPRSRAPQAAQAAKARPKPRSRAPQAAQATGPYAGALNQLNTEAAQTSDVERRQLSDNQAYQEWLRAGNRQRAAALQSSDTAQQDRATRIQAATAAAQQQTQQTLDAQRATRVGSVTDPGSTRARLAGDDVLTQALLASEQQRSAITAQSSAQKQGFLGAATEAAGAASAATIRGQAGERLQDVERRRGELLVHRDDTLSAERVAKAAAAADAIQAQIDGARADRSIDARLAIAEATLGQRASDNAASRALTAQQGRANRRTRKELARAKGSAKKGVSPAEKRQRAESARDLDADVVKATTVAKALARGGKKKDGTKVPGTSDPDVIRAGILALYPNISADALDAAVDAVTAGGGVAGAVNRATGQAKVKKARRKRLSGS